MTIKNLLYIGISSLLVCGFLTGISFGVNTKDRLSKSFNLSHNAQGEPYSSDLEADDVFNTNATIGSGGIGTSDSVLVRLARFMMRLGVMLGVPLLLYSALKIGFSFGDPGKLNDALKQVGKLLGGLFIILFSVMLVILITSLTRSSLDLNLFGS